MRDWKPALRRPVIYAFTTPDRPSGELKVGFTTKTADARVREILGQATPNPYAYDMLLEHPAILPDGRMIRDSDVHHVLENQLGRHRFPGTEWFRATRDDVIAAIESLETGRKLTKGRHQSFGMRPEQSAAVEKAAGYFRRYAEARGQTGLHFLWNAKMRFGKTFASYKLAQEMDWSRVLVLTYKPAVEDAWRDDLNSHADFEGWTFIGNREQEPSFGEKTVWFSSFQALFPKDGQLSPRLKPIFETKWDAIILDEYHFGADKDRAASIMQDDSETIDDLDLQRRIETGEAGIRADHFLHLSGTPFRALATGEFTEDQIFNWTYTDEQRAKAAWKEETANPYEALPGMVLMTYKLPQGILDEYEEEELNLDTFFKAGKVDDSGTCAFENERPVELWLDFITGTKLKREEFLEDEKNRSPMPFQDKKIFPFINHSLWYMPDVASCHAMSDKIRSHPTLRQYHVVVAAGKEAGIGIDALPPVREAIQAHAKTITLSCGKLTTGVTVPEWTAVFMLRSMKSPESYFQTAFRAQSPGFVIPDPKQGPVMKDRCFVFDFDPRRALTLASEYCYELDRISGKETTTKDDLMGRMQEFLAYMPVLCHDNGVMMELDPGAAIELATSGVGTAMLARRFQSPKMVDLNPLAVMRLQGDPELVEALAKIEAFRNLSKDLQTITAENVKAGKINADGSQQKEPKPAKPPKIDPAVKKLMEEIKKNLLKFITRLPVFMYLNDEREKTALEVIATTDDALFKRATGITKADFRKLLDLGVFQSEFMNEAIRTFKLVEDNALVYLGDREITGAYTAAWDAYVER